jgi:hypothetical protein
MHQSSLLKMQAFRDVYLGRDHPGDQARWVGGRHGPGPGPVTQR